jgi:hypothetical protein
MRIEPRDLPRVARSLLRTYGVTGIGRRALYESQLRSGYLPRTLPATTELIPAEPGWDWPLRLDLSEIRHGYAALGDVDAIREQVVREAERTLAGETRFYGWAWKEVGWPPRWQTNPWTGRAYPQVHWSQISDLQPEVGDIKDVWEMSRWPFTYLLARAWLLTDDDRYPEAWWAAVEDWIAQNPPNLGVNWRCGQETSLRGIAAQFGLMAFGDHPSATADRLLKVGGLLRASVERVAPTLRYALSQRNNHAISEAVFLETAALGGVGPASVGRSARRALEEAVADQFYADGWYAQHSLNYLRLALHALVWLDRVRTLAGLAPVEVLRDVLGRSAELVDAVVEPTSGWAPNLGANDGALLFPLSTCEHRDLRPVLATLGRPVADQGGGPEHEEAVWLRPDREPSGTRSSVDGRHLVVLEGPRSRAVIRSGSSRHRQSHDDLLHLDLWIDGENVLADPGTYRYTAPAPWGNALADRRVHNVPFTDHASDLRLGRFLRVSWPHAEIVEHARRDGTELVELRFTDDRDELCRTVLRRGDHYLIVDDGFGEPFTTRWTCGSQAEVELTARGAEITTACGRLVAWGEVEVLAADPDDPSSAWIAPHYAQREPTTAVLVRDEIPRRRVFLVGPREDAGLAFDVTAIATGGLPPERWLSD